MKHLKSKFAAMTVAALTLPVMAAAQTVVPNPFLTAGTQAGVVGQNAGIVGANTPLPVLIGRIINVVLGFLGIVFLCLILYAGFLWMTAQGDAKVVDKAKEILKQAIIGLIVIVAGFAISSFVLGSLYNISSTA